MRLSIIIPAYNEVHRIGATLEHLNEYLAERDYDSEIIVVDDCSHDETLSFVRREFPETQTLTYKPHRGKGGAVKTGMLAGCGDYRLFYDADASTPIEEIEKLWPHFEDGADVVIGSRWLHDSEIIVRQSLMRRLSGRAFNMLVKLFHLNKMPDTQCGFKMFTAQACQEIFPRQTIDGFAFDVEILYLATRNALRVDQVPIRWVNSPKSKVRLVTGSLAMFLELLRILLKTWRGLY